MPILSGVMNTYVGYALHAQDKTELHAIISLGVGFFHYDVFILVRDQLYNYSNTEL